MSALDAIPDAALAGPYGTVNVLLETLDELDAMTRQRAALGFLSLIPDPDDDPASLPLRRVLLAVLEQAIVDTTLIDFDSQPQPNGLTVRHLRRLIDMREDADRRLAHAAHHVTPADLSALFDGIASEAQGAGLH